MNTEDKAKALVAEVSSQIKKDGCYHKFVEPDVYHAAKKELEEKFKCPVVSKSILWDFMNDPYGARWRAISEEKKDTEALRKGSLIDCLTLTPECFENLYAVEEINRRTNAGKARAAELEEAGKSIITPKEYEDAKRVATLARTAIENYLSVYHTQLACWAMLDEVNGEKLPCKVILTGMFDAIGGEQLNSPIVDLKTTSRSIISKAEINRNMAEYGYGIQAAIYSDLSSLVLKQDRPFLFLYVSLDQPTRMRWVNINPCDVEMYRARYYQALHEYTSCWKNDDWGDAMLPYMTYEVPAWDLKKGGQNG